LWYQQIWDADENGFNCYLASAKQSPSGQVWIEIEDKNPNPALFTVKPDGTDITAYQTYQLVMKLFDHYRLFQGRENLEQKKQDVYNFLNGIITTKVIMTVKKILFSMTQRDEFSDSSDPSNWIEYLRKLWFNDSFDSKVQSLFEHVFVGEFKGKNALDGHHFWFKYFLEDSGQLQVNGKAVGTDLIKVINPPAGKKGFGFTPEVVCVEYTLNEGNKQLFKSEGGFFVGVSPECLIALGALSYEDAKTFMKESRGAYNFPITLNNNTYALLVVPNGRDGNPERTFYPKLQE